MTEARYYSTLSYQKTTQDTCLLQKVTCGLLNYVVANSLVISANECGLLFQSLIESPVDLGNDGIADDLEWPLKVISDILNRFFVRILIHSIMNQVTYSGRTSYVSNYYVPARREGGIKRCFCPSVRPSVAYIANVCMYVCIFIST